MIINLPEIEEIYFSKSKEYFKEVLSSYANGNYRSATVMLYSVAVCDILFKLRELKDMYNDSVAAQILETVEREQSTSNKKSSWEKTLVEQIRQKTQLLDDKSYSDMRHLFDDRNLSAHPAMTQDFELIAPSQETTIAHIKNILNGILIKPPIFIKNVVDMLTEDLKCNAKGYPETALKTYLQNKYYARMTVPMKTVTFKAFWKFCFKMSGNDDCLTNLDANFLALSILVGEDPKMFAQAIHEEQSYFTIDNFDIIKFKAVNLFANLPILYTALDATVKAFIDQYIDGNIKAMFGAWFQFNSLKKHLERLKEKLSNVSVFGIDADATNFVVNKYKAEGLAKELIDWFISLFGESYSYDDADHRCDTFILPFLSLMTKEQYQELFSNISSNRQIYDRNAAYPTNTKIIKASLSILPKDYDFAQYENLRYDKTVLMRESE